ncbi:MAG: metallophosphoesterase [Pelobacteraceae bacterium]
MYLFLITFLTLYGGMHLYAFLRLRDLFRPRRLLTWFLTLWMVVMTIIPLLVRAAEQFGNQNTARLIAWPGYLWMGFLFIFITLLLFTDLLRLVYRFAVFQLSRSVPKNATSRIFCGVALVLALVATVYAFFEADQIRSEHVVLTSSKLLPSTPRIRIVQISDVHIGLLLQEVRMQRIIEMIREAGPDILVSTGDLVDGKLNRDDALSEFTPLAAVLASVPAPSGKYAVIGNHEVYAGLSQAAAFTRAAGFTLLRNRSITLANGMTISGVDDIAAYPRGYDNTATETALLATVSPNSFHLLLKHRPEIPPQSDGRFDVQLSGHVHGGQLFPFNYLVKLKYPIPCGTTSTQTGSQIHVSRGTGTWGPPMRLFVPPEITIIDVIPQTPNTAR